MGVHVSHGNDKDGGGGTATADRDTHGQGATGLIKDSSETFRNEAFGGPTGDNATARPDEDDSDAEIGRLDGNGEED